MSRLMHALLALTFVSGSAMAIAPSNQVYSCEINKDEAVYATLEQGVLTYHYKNAAHPDRNSYYPRDGTNKNISIYHHDGEVIDGTPVETIRISFHADAGAETVATVLSMDMSPEDEAFAIPTIQFIVNGDITKLIPCEYDSDAIYLMRDAIAGNTIASGYSVDKVDPLRPR